MIYEYGYTRRVGEEVITVIFDTIEASHEDYAKICQSVVAANRIEREPGVRLLTPATYFIREKL